MLAGTNSSHLLRRPGTKIPAHTVLSHLTVPGFALVADKTNLQDMAMLDGTTLPQPRCQSRRALRHGLVLEGDCLPSPSSQHTLSAARQIAATDLLHDLATKNSHRASFCSPSHGNSNDILSILTPASHPEAPCKPAGSSSKSFSRQEATTSRTFKSLVHHESIAALLSCEEVVRLFYGALDPAHHHHLPAVFLRTYERLVHDSFTLHTGGGNSSKAQWAHYWELMVSSGATVTDLQIMPQQDEVSYTVDLRIGATTIHFEHIARCEDSKLTHIYPDIKAGSASPPRLSKYLFRKPGARPIEYGDDFDTSDDSLTMGTQDASSPTNPRNS